MPPKRKKNAAAQIKFCVCGRSFASAKAFGNHVGKCMDVIRQQSTRQLHHQAQLRQAEASLQSSTPTDTNNTCLVEEGEPSLKQQRKMLITGRGAQSLGSDDTILDARQHRHHEIYKLQLQQMRTANVDDTTLPNDNIANDEGATETPMMEDDNDIMFEPHNDTFDAEETVDAGDGTVENNIASNHNPPIPDDREPLFPILPNANSKHRIHFQGTVSPATAAGIQLMKVLGKHTTDLSLYDDIVTFINELADTNYNFRQKIPSRHVLKSTCEQAFQYQCLKPKLVSVHVATMSVPTVLVPIFDIQAVLTKMLTNPTLMQAKHFAANYDIFTGASSSDKGNERRCSGDDYDYYDEIHTGRQWTTAVNHYCSGNENLFPCGLVIFYDKSHADRHGSLAVSPIMFTPTFFNKAARAQSQFWDILAYIPNLDSGTNKTSDSSIAQSTTPELKCQDEHTCLFAALRQLKDANDRGGIPIKIMGKDVKVKVWVHIMVGDICGNNALLGSYNNANVQCPYRDCSCAKESFVDPNAICRFIRKADIDEMKRTNNRAALKAASKHNIVNAFDTIPTGDPIHTIYRLTPPETMHAICAGIAPRIISNMGKGLKKTNASTVMNNLHLLLAQKHSLQSERDLPRPSQRNHILETTKTQATEHMGNLFLIMCSLHTNMGIRICTNANISPYQRKGKIETIMMVLSLEKWFNRRNHKSDVDDTSKVDYFIRHKVIPNLQKYFPRDEGLGWTFPKVHSLTKFPSFIQAFGSAINFYGGFGESHLKDFMKHYAHFTQRRPDKFATQLANNHYQHGLFEHSSFCIRMQTKSNFVLTAEVRQHNFTGEHSIRFEHKSNINRVACVEYNTTVSWKTATSTKPLDNTLRYTLSHYMAMNGPLCSNFRVMAYTNAKLPNCQDTLEPYDAGPSHSLYKVDTQANRFDWCMIRTHSLGSEIDDERLDVLEYVCPARIHGFVRFETGGIPTPCLLQKHNAETIRHRGLIDDTMYVIVRTHEDFLTWKQLEKGFVLPIRLGNLDACTYILPVSRIVNPLYVFEDHGQSAEATNPSFFAALPARYWAFYLDYKLNPQLIPGHGGLSQKCEEYTE